MATNEIRAEENRRYRLIKEFSQESKLVVIASIALIASIIAALLSAYALHDALHASIKVDVELTDLHDKVVQARESADFWRAMTIDMRAEMKARGYDVPPLPPPPKEEQ